MVAGIQFFGIEDSTAARVSMELGGFPAYHGVVSLASALATILIVHWLEPSKPPYRALFYFDVIQLDDTRLGICISDVAGKGITAALLTQRKIMEGVSGFCRTNFHDDATLLVVAIQ